MSALIKNDQEAKAARIDEATDDWFSSQEFPSVPVVSKGSNIQTLSRFVSPIKEPVEIGSITSMPPLAAVAA